MITQSQVDTKSSDCSLQKCMSVYVTKNKKKSFDMKTKTSSIFFVNFYPIAKDKIIRLGYKKRVVCLRSVSRLLKQRIYVNTLQVFVIFFMVIGKDEDRRMKKRRKKKDYFGKNADNYGKKPVLDILCAVKELISVADSRNMSKCQLCVSREKEEGVPVSVSGQATYV